MDFELTTAQKETRDAARTIAEEVLLPRARAHDREEKFPAEQVKALANGGFLAMLVPREFGGTEQGSVRYSLAMTEVARACASTSVTMAVTNMVCDAICAFGSEAQKKRFVPKLATAELLAGSFALSEPDAGSDAASLKATAVRKGDKYILNGSKCWITSGDVAGVLLVMAKTDLEKGSRGISAFLVEPDMKGFSVGRHEEKMGLRGSSTVTINLDEVEVPESARVGPEGIGFKIAMRALDGGRIGIGSQALGIGRAAFEAAAAHMSERDETPEQSIQWRLADTATELDAARLLVLRAATMKDAGVPFSKEASMAKVFATEAANRATHAALEVLGEAGLTGDVSQVERYLRDVRVTTIYEGTSEIQRFVIARQLLTEA